MVHPVPREMDAEQLLMQQEEIFSFKGNYEEAKAGSERLADELSKAKGSVLISFFTLL